MKQLLLSVINRKLAIGSTTLGTNTLPLELVITSITGTEIRPHWLVHVDQSRNCICHEFLTSGSHVSSGQMTWHALVMNCWPFFRPNATTLNVSMATDNQTVGRFLSLT